jgi:hypothetical protein
MARPGLEPGTPRFSVLICSGWKLPICRASAGEAAPEIPLVSWGFGPGGGLPRPIPRSADGETRNRTEDTTIFSRMLYQLSYLAATHDPSGSAARMTAVRCLAAERGGPPCFGPMTPTPCQGRKCPSPVSPGRGSVRRRSTPAVVEQPGESLGWRSHRPEADARAM